MIVRRERVIAAPEPSRKTILQNARDLDLRLEREPKDPEQEAILFRIFRDRLLLGRYWPISQTLEIDGEERRVPDICEALKALATAGLRQAA